MAENTSSPMPAGIERVLAIAAVDDAFASNLFSNRESAVKASGVSLTPTEKAILLSIDNKALDQMIKSIDKRIPDHNRRDFLKMSAAALLALVSAGSLNSCIHSHSKGIQPDIPDQTKINQLLNGINAQRASLSLPALTADPLVQSAAQEYANHLEQAGVGYGETCPCGCGSTLAARLSTAGAVYVTPPDPAECGIRSFSAANADTALVEILTDETFKSNVENPAFTHIGVAYKGKIYSAPPGTYGITPGPSYYWVVDLTKGT